MTTDADFSWLNRTSPTEPVVRIQLSRTEMAALLLLVRPRDHERAQRLVHEVFGSDAEWAGREMNAVAEQLGFIYDREMQ